MNMPNRFFPSDVLFRSFFRDTLLLAASLRLGAQPKHIKELRVHCDALIAALQDDLTACALFTSEEVKEVIYAQCAFLDESVLMALSTEARVSWQQNPLQVVHFGSYDGGEVVCTRVQILLEEKEPARHLLSCYYVIFSMGFKGRYLLRPESELEVLLKQLSQAMQQEQFLDGPLLIDAGPRPFWSRWRSLSPMTYMVSAALLVVLVYVLLSGLLSSATQSWA